MAFPYNSALSVHEVGMAGSEGLNGMKVDNIKLQELEGLFFTVLFAFLESGRASRINLRRRLTKSDPRIALQTWHEVAKVKAQGCKSQTQETFESFSWTLG